MNKKIVILMATIVGLVGNNVFSESSRIKKKKVHSFYSYERIHEAAHSWSPFEFLRLEFYRLPEPEYTSVMATAWKKQDFRVLKRLDEIGPRRKGYSEWVAAPLAYYWRHRYESRGTMPSQNRSPINNIIFGVSGGGPAPIRHGVQVFQGVGYQLGAGPAQ